MATEKTKNVVNDDPMETVSIRIPRNPFVKEKGVFVSVNNLRYFIPYGQNVFVPRCIAEVAELSMAQDEYTADRLAAMSEA